MLECIYKNGNVESGYAPEFRSALAKEAVESNCTYQQTADKYGVKLNTLRNWINKYRVENNLARRRRGSATPIIAAATDTAPAPVALQLPKPSGRKRTDPLFDPIIPMLDQQIADLKLEVAKKDKVIDALRQTISALLLS